MIKIRVEIKEKKNDEKNSQNQFLRKESNGENKQNS